MTQTKVDKSGEIFGHQSKSIMVLSPNSPWAALQLRQLSNSTI